MQNFAKLKKAVHSQFKKMAKGKLFRTMVSGSDLWDTYLSSFPPGSNPIYKERTEHDCNCCKQFVRACGNVVSIADNKLVSLWDITTGDPNYQVVVDALAVLVKSQPIHTPFLRTESRLGTDFNHQQLEDGTVKKWNHFHFELPAAFVVSSTEIGGIFSNATATAHVFERGLYEISTDVVETVLELIDQNSIYRGVEHKAVLELFLEQIRKFEKLTTDVERNIFIWAGATRLGGAARIRNTVIGTLLVDLAQGKELDKAVSAFEKNVAPTNYKRPRALVSKAMIKKAQEKVEALGLTSALSRRHATFDDITINNVIFADRTARQAMNVFEEMANEVPVDPKKFSKREEVSIDTFIEDILPKAKVIELQMENRHESNLMSLIAPVNDDVEPLFKWPNNFSWAYQGEVADSIIKQRVKSAGGNIDAVLRFSIMWNDGDDNQNDFDAHSTEPNGNHIWFGNKGIVQPTSGMLDVDIIRPGRNPAVENITWTDLKKMKEGRYRFYVHNYTHNGGRTGFTAEIEYDGTIHTFVYGKELRQNENVTVAEIDFSKTEGIKFVTALSSTVATKEIWGLNTNRFHRTRVIMKSPNHWDGKKTGNMHWFFILEDCLNPIRARGFFNEFLKNDLTEHRKVFEVLGSKMRAEVSEEQLSGLGFSSTKRNSILCRVTGKSTREVRINF